MMLPTSQKPMSDIGETKTNVELRLGSSYVLHSGEVIDIVEDNFSSWRMKPTAAGFVGRERKYGGTWSFHKNGRIAGGFRNENGNCIRDVRVAYPWYRAARQHIASIMFQLSNKLTRKLDRLQLQRKMF